MGNMRLTSRILIVFFCVIAFVGRAEAAMGEKGMVPGDCLECHPELKKEISSQKAHAPVKKKQCLQCHNPHAANIDKLLVQPRDELCLRCHKELGDSLQTGMGHDPAKKGECLKCHRPHSSPRQHLLVANQVELCGSCHEAKGALNRAVVHKPTVEKRQCSSCHDAHVSGQPYLLEKQLDRLCLGCHKVSDLEGRKGHLGFTVKGSACESCHSPHSSDRKGLLRANMHQPYEKGLCNKCHAGEISGGRMKKSDEGLCLDCHQQVEGDFQKIFRHVQGPRSNYCLHCHGPHGSDEPALRRGKDKTICLRCHENKKWTVTGEEPLVRHPLRSEGRCTACHRPHGSDFRLFLDDDENAICSRCHTHQGKFSHPIGPEAPDPRSKRGMTCLSCHDPMGAEHEYNLLFDRARELCVQCHKR